VIKKSDLILKLITEGVMNVDEQTLIKHSEDTQSLRVTKAQIESKIAYVNYFTAAQGVDRANEGNPQGSGDWPESLMRLTFCTITMKNGFSFTGESACADPKAFNEKIGKQIAYDHAFEKIWSHEGYLLREKLSQEDTSDYLSRMWDEYRQLDARFKKLKTFMSGVVFQSLKEGQQQLLHRQCAAMLLYVDVLYARISMEENLKSINKIIKE
jgi:hypothetical protein